MLKFPAIARAARARRAIRDVLRHLLSIIDRLPHNAAQQEFHDAFPMLSRVFTATTAKQAIADMLEHVDDRSAYQTTPYHSLLLHQASTAQGHPRGFFGVDPMKTIGQYIRHCDFTAPHDNPIKLGHYGRMAHGITHEALAIALGIAYDHEKMRLTTDAASRTAIRKALDSKISVHIFDEKEGHIATIPYSRFTDWLDAQDNAPEMPRETWGSQAGAAIAMDMPGGPDVEYINIWLDKDGSSDDAKNQKAAADALAMLHNADGDEADKLSQALFWHPLRLRTLQTIYGATDPAAQEEPPEPSTAVLPPQVIAAEQEKSDMDIALLATLEESEDHRDIHFAALAYLTNRSRGRDLKKARILLEKAASKGSLNALTDLATMYARGDGVQRDSRKAFELRKKAAEAGNLDAQVLVGNMYTNGTGTARDVPQGLHWLNTAAQRRHPEAWMSLGMMYEHANGVPRDRQRAIEYYRMAAESNYPDAMTNLAAAYTTGSGVPRDNEKALSLYEKASKMGDFMGILGIGLHYMNNEDRTPENLRKAYMHLKEAHLAGITTLSINHLRRLRGALTPEQIMESHAKAEKDHATRDGRLAHFHALSITKATGVQTAYSPILKQPSQPRQRQGLVTRLDTDLKQGYVRDVLNGKITDIDLLQYPAKEPVSKGDVVNYRTTFDTQSQKEYAVITRKHC